MSAAGAPLARADRVAAAALVGCALALDLAWSRGLGLEGALGTDAPLWGLSAEGLHHGAVPAVPPLWPALLALLRGLGAPLVEGGVALSWLLAGLVPAATFLAARAALAPRAGALVAALLVLCCPDLVGWSAELQSNSLVALALALVTGLWAAVLARQADPARPGQGSGTTALLAAVLTGLLPLARENLVGATALALVAAPVALRRGWRLSLVLLAAWWLSPLLLGQAPGASPLDTAWGARGGMALGDLATGAGPLPNYVGEIPRAERAAYVAHLREGDLPALAAFHARRSLRIATDGWAVAAVALLAVLVGPGRRSTARAALLPLATCAPALLVWTQRRHVLLALPALLAIAATLWPAPPSPAPPLTARPRLLAGARLLALALLGLALANWPAAWVHLAREQQGETKRAATLRELGDWLCGQDALFLGGPVQDAALYCPRPRHDLDGSVADWHTLVVLPRHLARATLPEGWVRVGPQAADLAVYRLHPDQPRPCPDGRPAPGSPYLSAGPVHATLVGCPEPPP